MGNYVDCLKNEDVTNRSHKINIHSSIGEKNGLKYKDHNFIEENKCKICKCYLDENQSSKLNKTIYQVDFKEYKNNRNETKNLDSTTTILCYLEECGHVFHHRCLMRWRRLTNRCPQCRRPFHGIYNMLNEKILI